MGVPRQDLLEDADRAAELLLRGLEGPGSDLRP